MKNKNYLEALRNGQLYGLSIIRAEFPGEEDMVCFRYEGEIAGISYYGGEKMLSRRNIGEIREGLNNGAIQNSRRLRRNVRLLERMMDSVTAKALRRLFARVHIKLYNSKEIRKTLKSL